jgi:maltokinase
MLDKRELAGILGSAAGHLSKRRWCASKGARSLKVHDTFPFFSSPTAMFFGAIFSFSGCPKVYCAPFALSSNKSTPMLEPVRIGDWFFGEAEKNPDFISMSIEAMRIGASGKKNRIIENVKWNGNEIPKGKVRQIRLLGIDSSNVVVGCRIGGVDTVYKGYRTFDAFNPEPELLSYISAKSAESVPRFLGQCTLMNSGSKYKRPVVLGILVERVGGTDAFRLAVEEAKGCIAKGDMKDVALAAGAGKALGELHKLLSAARTPDLKPERITKKDVERWQTRIADEYHSALKLLDGENMKKLAWAAKELAPLVGGMKTLAGGPKLRTHQDLHLGQMLFDAKKQKMTIIDFEGEPMRRGKERIEKLPPERDVATMLRSFSYAAAVALMEYRKDAGIAPEKDEGKERGAGQGKGKCPVSYELAQARALMWEKASEVAFIIWYISETINGTPDLEQFWKRVDPWLAEKALYEIIYEAKYRPDWVGIPLGGLLNVLERRVS